MNARNTIRLTGLPLLRDGDFPCSPAYETALRTSGWVEMAFQKRGKEVCIFISSEVADYGFLEAYSINYEEVADRPDPSRSMVLLSREIRKVTVSNGGPASLECRLVAIRAGTDRKSFWAALSKADEGTGFSLFVRRRREALPTKLSMRLSGAADAPIVHELKRCTDHFQVVAAIYGNQNATDVVRLVKEAEACWGLHADIIAPTNTVPEQLLGQVNDPLSTIFLAEEARALMSLMVSPDCDALPFNKDTISGSTPFSPPGEGLRLGKTDRGLPVCIRWLDVSKHIVLFGPPGSGKTNALFNICEQLFAKQVPVLVLEPAKNEFVNLQSKWHCNVWRPATFPINPFAVPTGVTLGQYRATLISILETSFNLDGPLVELFGKTMTRCFARAGWAADSTPESQGVRPFGLHEFAIEYNKILEMSGYSDRVKADIRQAGLVRIERLFSESDAFDSVKSIPASALVNGINIIQTYELTSLASKQLVFTFLLLSLAAYIRMTFKTATGEMPRLVIVIDEAHNLFSVDDSTGFAELFQSLLLELRSVGVGIILADQAAGNLPDIVSKVPAHKLFCSGAYSSGITSYAEELGLDDVALSNLWRIGRGEGLYFNDGLPHALFFRTSDILGSYLGSSHQTPANAWQEMNPRFTLETYAECVQCPARGRCTHESKAQAELAARQLEMDLGPKLIAVTKNKNGTEQGKVLAILEARLEALPEITRQCALTKFSRLINRDGEVNIDVEVLRNVLFTKKRKETQND